MYRSEENKISMRRLNIFTELSTYITHSQLNRLGITLLETLVLATRLMFSKELLISFLQESHRLWSITSPVPVLLTIPLQSFIITIETLRTRSKLHCEAELCFSILSPDRLSESSHYLSWPGILPEAAPLLPPALFSWSMSNACTYTTLHHHHFPFQVLFRPWSLQIK